ncbi:RNA-directed DNA polymerase [Candidatus Falkowbacteria bacterium]|nr:RNA-directed DNA polymerase [Candidatus Falkowbacteria bacterium]
MRGKSNYINKALLNVKHDISDDFWPDILSYSDYLDMNFPAGYFKNYTPDQIIPLNIPKPTLILRPGHFIKFTDRIYFQMIINEFAGIVDKKLYNKNIVFSHRLSSSGGNFFENQIDAWKRFNKKTDNFFNENEYGFLLKSDISAYFEHIIIKKLISVLLNLGVKKTSCDKLSALLNTWGEFGIPQGYDASSFLGNVYLHEVDDEMIRSGFNYYRFADDIRVFAKDEDEARAAIEKITELFRPLNLHLSGGKTSILDKEKYFAKKNEYSDEMDAINYSVYRNRSKLNLSLPKLKKIWQDGIKRRDKTLINFCINRFKNIKSDHPLNIIIKKKLIDPSFTPVIMSYLQDYISRRKVQEMLLNLFNSTPYIYQKIFILKTFLNAKKIFFDVYQIKKEDVCKTNNFLLIGYYLVFIGKFGTSGQKNTIKNDYEQRYSQDDKISRYFLIALKYFNNSHQHISFLLRTKISLKYTANYLKSKKAL